MNVRLADGEERGKTYRSYCLKQDQIGKLSDTNVAVHHIIGARVEEHFIVICHVIGGVDHQEQV